MHGTISVPPYSGKVIKEALRLVSLVLSFIRVEGQEDAILTFLDTYARSLG